MKGMRFVKRFLAIILTVLLISSSAFCFAGASNPVLTSTMKISADNISYEISDKLYGISLDDSNFAIDSSLVANLINNGSFELTEREYSSWIGDGFGIRTEQTDNGEELKFGTFNASDSAVLKNLGYAETLKDNSQYSISEKSIGQMSFVKGEEYVFTGYFKNYDFKGEINVSLGEEKSVEQYLIDISNCNDWTKITVEMTSEMTGNGALIFSFTGEGTFYFDNFTLVPKSSYGFGNNGWKNVTLNNEMVKALDELSPAFIRFSESFYIDLEGNIHGWKDSIGEITERKPACEMLEDENGYYENSNQMGFYEYLKLCEDLGAEAIPEFNIGIIDEYADQYAETLESYVNGEMTEKLWNLYIEKLVIGADNEKFEIILQNILDMLEYALGDESTLWGAKRADDGHPEPFELNYISLGKYNTGKPYWDNFTVVYNKIKEQYPNIQVISAFDEELNKNTFKEEMKAVDTNFKDVLVNESYVKIDSLYENLERYDEYDRTGAKIVVESFDSYAEGIGKGVTRNNIWSAIENSVFLLTLEKNSDLVMMASDKCTIANKNAFNGNNSLIWTNGEEILLTADYYAQMLLANNVGTNYITTDFDMSGEGIYQSTTVDTENQVIYVKLINTMKKPQNFDIQLQGFENINNPSVQYMSEKFKSACNKFDEQLHVAPTEEKLEIKDSTVSYYMNSHSISVIRIPYGENDGSALYTLPETDVISPYMHPAISIVVPCVLGVLVVGVGVVILVVRIKHHKKAKKKDEE